MARRRSSSDRGGSPRAAASSRNRSWEEHAAAPTWFRDPWAWTTTLGVLPLLLKCVGAPLGEPVAEDFDFLHRTLFHGMGSLLDGGGSQAFWRPLAHQVYYAALGPLILSHPLLMALLHAVLLALGALLLYRVFRLELDGATATVAATFPMLAESTRTVLGWPTQFVDLGLFLFSALALHEISRRRLASALSALLAALLCKEVAVVTAVLMPLLPVRATRAERVRWGIGAGAVVVVWAGVYLVVRRTVHLELPHGLEHDARTLAVSPLARLAWAIGSSLRAIFSLPIVPDRWAPLAVGSSLALLLALALAAISARVRTSFRARWAWIAWGLGWFVIASASLTPIYPFWQPNRSLIGSVGLGIAAASALGVASPLLPAALVASRLAMLALAPGPASNISGDPPATGAFMDFARLTRLERFMRESRGALREKQPVLAPGSTVLLVNMPHLVLYALGGDRALQAWYRDSTLRFRIQNADVRLPRPATAVLQYQPRASPELIALDATAFWAQEEAYAEIQNQHFNEGYAHLGWADSLERNPRAVMFRANTLGLRAFGQEIENRHGEATENAGRALEIDPHNQNARLVLAAEALRVGDLDRAQGHVDSLLTDDPLLPGALKLGTWIAEARAAHLSRRSGGGAP